MPKMPQAPRSSLLTPLAAQRLNPIFVDRWNDSFRLRTLTPAEVTPEIAEWLADPAIMEGLNAPRQAMGLDAFRAYVTSFDNLKRSVMAVRRREDDGAVGLIVLEVDLRHKLGSVHMVVGDPDNRGKRVSLEAMRLLCRMFFRERKLEKLTFQPLARNLSAIKACENAGLRLEGTLRGHRIDGATGERLDQLLYALSVEEYEERSAARVFGTYGGPGIKP
ncbi:MAG: GNAT family protein [Mesorhizobium sp.]|nr:GNAT family protein [Mesorhizobium sp.]